MFRKKRSSSQHRHQHQLSTSNTQNAQSAATRAFVQSRPSSSNLSSAAAAAALRSLTPTPTPVENVQTRRMLQRQSSISSQPVGSPTLRPTSRNGLRRSNSSTSMSARTFRDQSPGRPASSYSTMSTPAVVPPLPSIPPEFAGRKNQNRRSVSVGPSVWPSSPRQTPDRAKGVKSPPTVPESPRIVATPDIPASPLHQRSESRNSINFSYPMHSRTNSPTIPAGTPVRSDAAHGAAASLNKRSSAHYKNTRQQAQGAKSGSPATNTRSGMSALAAAQAAIVPRSDEPQTTPAPARQTRQQPAPERSMSRSPTPAEAKPRPAVKKSPARAEDRPVKERAQPAPASPSVRASAPSPTPIPAKEQENQPLVVPTEPPRALTPPVAEKSLRTPPVSPPQSKSPQTNGDTQPAASLRQSSSPARSAHFPTQLTVMNPPNDQLHQPPARSLSPAKSAMKNRNSSLSPDGRLSGILRPGPPLNELSDATSVASDDGARPKSAKKSVKVSFDDEAEIVGVAASPPTSPEEPLPMSPPGTSKSKTGWFNLHKRKSSPLPPTDGDEFDEVLKPRAALPSFGSVRGKKDGARPEATAAEEADDDSASDSDDDFPNGHAINNLISRSSDGQTQVQHNDALPAIVTDASARDDADSQDPLSPSDSDLEPASDVEPAYFQKTQLSPLPEVPSDQNLPLTEETIPELPEMPDITLQPATPDPEKHRASLDQWDSPQEYPRQASDVGLEDVIQQKGKRRSYDDPPNSPSNDSSSSVYSDAEEDLDDGEGDGFGSINAIVKNEPAEPGVAITTTQDESNKAGHSSPTDIPETCQIARVESPVHEPIQASSPGVVEPLPVSTTPSPPTKPQDKTESDQRGIARSSTVPVEVHSIAQVRDDDPKEVDTRQTANAQKPRGQNQKRPEPIRRKEVNSRDSANFELNGNAHMHRRQLSNGSDDSTSSFRRARRGSRGGMGMRMTLRGNQQGGSVPASPAPIDPPPLPTGLGAGTMRTTLRNGPSKKEKPSFFSTSKSQKGKPAKLAGTGASFATRFPDSDSDSDSGLPNRRLQRPSHRATRSMSDNDMRPVRGIPRRKGAYDGDSTELEDSSDGERRPSSAPKTSAPKASARQPPPTTIRDPALAAVAKSRGMTEKELEQLLSRGSNDSPRKPSILNRFSMRKSKPSTQRGKLQISESLSALPIPETTQEQAPPVPNGTPKSPSRLLKKSQRSQPGDAWPLGSEQADPVDSGIGSASSPSTSQPARPQTPDGNAVNGNGTKTAAQVPFGVSTDCQPSQDKESPAGNRASDVVIEGSGRKKRFQRLKKAFGIRG